MFGSTALVLLALGTQQPTLHDPATNLRLDADVQTSPWALDVQLRTRLTLNESPLFLGQHGRHRGGSHGAAATTTPPPATASTGAGADTAPTAAPAPAAAAAPATPPASEPSGDSASPAATASGDSATTATSGEGGAAAAEECDIDCETCRESDRHARYVFRNRARTLRTHRALGIATWSAMVVTEALGTLLAINQDTWFGRGNCASDPGAFGCYQNSLIQGLHEGFAVATTALYTTTAIMAVAAPDPENAAEGDDGAPRTLRRHKWLAWVHGAGMVLLPILGIVSTHPQIFGINDEGTRADFTRATRSVHLILGYGTLAALTTAGILEF